MCDFCSPDPTEVGAAVEPFHNPEQIKNQSSISPHSVKPKRQGRNKENKGADICFQADEDIRAQTRSHGRADM